MSVVARSHPAMSANLPERVGRIAPTLSAAILGGVKPARSDPDRRR
jgi:hypothetical protein